MLTCVFQQNTKEKWYWKYKDISFREYLTDKIALLSIASLACWVHRTCQGCNVPNMAGSAQTGQWHEGAIKWDFQKAQRGAQVFVAAGNSKTAVSINQLLACKSIFAVHILRMVLPWNYPKTFIFLNDWESDNVWELWAIYQETKNRQPVWYLVRISYWHWKCTFAS